MQEAVTVLLPLPVTAFCADMRCAAPGAVALATDSGRGITSPRHHHVDDRQRNR
jgi:hypothetical protein